VRSVRSPLTLATFLSTLAAVVVLSLPACSFAEGGDEACNDDQDNDADGRIDCADPGCALSAACNHCGDGVLQDNEACDDGNTKADDGCDERCRKEGCGNGELDDGEECDDGNVIPADGCNFRCEVDRCGNGQPNENLGEECDDGNLVPGDGCSVHCQEEIGARCGDGVIDWDLEETCDDGNRRDNDGCSALCIFEVCGDNKINAPGEQCDGADNPTNARCDFCRLNFCGNGDLDPGEECDDGDNFDNDGCNFFCRLERCGDFNLQNGEQCDDGNQSSGDGCNAECRVEVCGDGVVQPRSFNGLELCDDGNNSNGDACGNDCMPNSGCAALPDDETDEVCFDAETRFISLVAMSMGVSYAPSANLLWLASLQNGQLEQIDLDTGADEFPPTAFRRPVLVTSFDFDGDGVAEAVLGNADQTVTVMERSGASLVERAVSAPNDFSEEGFVPIDLAVGPLAGGAEADVLGVVPSALQLHVILDPLTDERTAALDLPLIARRVIAAPALFAAGGGLVLADQERIAAARITLAGDTIGVIVSDPIAVDGTVGDLALADVDDDGTRDLVVLTRAPDALLAFPLDGGGLGATPVVLADTPGADRVTVGDVDGDLADDFVTSSGSGPIVVHLARDGWAARTALPGPISSARPLVTDADGDGDMDIIGAGGFAGAVVVIYTQQ
jgi:cysteine-rich repeat protein